MARNVCLLPAVHRSQRRQLVDYWVSEQLNQAIGEVERIAAAYSRLQQELAAVQQVSDSRLLRDAAVVGMTTAGVASLQELIGTVGPKVSCEAIV